MLPDSSTMRLSPSSVLIYDKSTFMARREVFLNGRAYADIAKSVDATTFTVRCNLASVIVRGTKFDINSYAEDREMEVILYEGGVEVTSDFGGRQDTMLLHPGNIVKIDKLTGDCNLLDTWS